MSRMRPKTRMWIWRLDFIGASAENTQNPFELPAFFYPDSRCISLSCVANLCPRHQSKVSLMQLRYQTSPPSP